jgi:hypothetical protein
MLAAWRGSIVAVVRPSPFAAFGVFSLSRREREGGALAPEG